MIAKMVDDEYTFHALTFQNRRLAVEGMEGTSW